MIRFHMTPHPISSRMGFHYDGTLNVCPLGLISPCHGLTLFHRDPLHTTLGDNVTEKVFLTMPQAWMTPKLTGILYHIVIPV